RPRPKRGRCLHRRSAREREPEMLVECKLWSAPVSQDAVHSMHTVMLGSGANTGFIVSEAGFQSGAYEAAANTNIHLLTWEELQQKFGRQWFLYRRDELKLLT